MLEIILSPVGIGLLGAITVALLVYGLLTPLFAGEKQMQSRLTAAVENRSNRVARRTQAEHVSSRRRAVADTIKELDSKQRKQKKVSLRLRLSRAGLRITPKTFWVISGFVGVATALLALVSLPDAPPVVFVVIWFAATFGVPRWYLSRKIKSRQASFVNEFADALDVIVRGVKSGLPFSECLSVIARESPEPVRGIFQDILDQQRVGVTLGDCLERAIEQMPVSEMKFFAIVVGIQAQAGGNLSEALGNLSGVIRARKQMTAKVGALSAEAKASAIVLGAMPFVVATMIYLSTPAYIMLLFDTKVGQFMLICSAVCMSMGILLMRKMINFKF
jgi:tight adherence protein B